MRIKALESLVQIESLMTVGKLRRYFTRPYRYGTLTGIRILAHLGFIRKVNQSIKTIFSFPLQLDLPSHADIYLYGTKCTVSDIFLIRYLIHRIHPGQTVIDVGASIGFYSLLISKLMQESGSILALEPSQNAYSLLEENIVQYQNVQARKISAGEKEALKTLYTFPTYYAEYNTHFLDSFLKQSSWFKQKNVKQETIPVKKLDDILEELGLTPDIVKLDAENSELYIVKGMERILKQSHPEIILRFWPLGRNNTRQGEAIAILRANGYILNGLTRDGTLTPLNTLSSYPLEYVILT